jgi:hypothetical protein
MSHLKRKEFKAGSVIAENSSLATHLCFVEAGHCVLTAPGLSRANLRVRFCMQAYPWMHARLGGVCTEGVCAGYCAHTRAGKEVQDVPVGESICEDAFLRFLFTLLAGSRSSDDASMRHRPPPPAPSLPASSSRPLPSCPLLPPPPFLPPPPAPSLPASLAHPCLS